MPKVLDMDMEARGALSALRSPLYLQRPTRNE